MTGKLLSLTPNLMVNDVNNTIKYYEDNLNFNTIMTVPESGNFNWAMLQRNDVMLMLQKKESLIEEYPIMEGRTMGGSLSLFVNVDNVKELYDTLKSNNKIKFAKDLEETFYGTTEFAIIDLNGYVITFSQR